MNQIFNYIVENIPELAFNIVEKIVILDYGVLIMNFSLIIKFIGKQNINTCFEIIINQISTNPLVVKLVNAVFYVSSINFV
jgi:hypothetical protein